MRLRLVDARRRQEALTERGFGQAEPELSAGRGRACVVTGLGIGPEVLRLVEDGWTAS
jgi:hypothetical protein